MDDNIEADESPNSEQQAAPAAREPSLGTQLRELRGILDVSQSRMASFILRAEKEIPELRARQRADESSAKSLYQSWETDRRRPRERLMLIFLAAESRKLNRGLVSLARIEKLIHAYEPTIPLSSEELARFFPDAAAAPSAPMPPLTRSMAASQADAVAIIPTVTARLPASVPANSDLPASAVAINSPAPLAAEPQARDSRTAANLIDLLSTHWRPIAALLLLLTVISVLLSPAIASFAHISATVTPTNQPPTVVTPATQLTITPTRPKVTLIAQLTTTPARATPTGLPASVTAAPRDTVVIAAPTAISVTRSVCGELRRLDAPNAFKFLADQGVIAYEADDSDGAILNDRIRSLAIDSRGVWIGYSASEGNAANGVGYHDESGWAVCPVPGQDRGKNINAMTIDREGRVWAATEKGGVLMFDGTDWHNYTRFNGLPTNETYGIAVDQNDHVWVATWEGVAQFDGQTWQPPLQEGGTTIFSSHSQALAFDSSGNIWVGHMGEGVSEYSKADNKWIYRSAAKGQLAGDEIFGIAIRPADSKSPESVWFATLKGVTKFEQGKWTSYYTGDGLPSNEVQAVAIDRYNRVWVATRGGVAYLDNGSWITYDTIPTLSLAFGPSCAGCPYDDDKVWTGTELKGLTYSSLPLPAAAPVIDLVGVRYRPFDTPTQPFSDTIVLAPGDEFVVNITVAVRAPYSLSVDRGDLLISVEPDVKQRYGAFVHMPVTSTVQGGATFTFSNYGNPFKAPDIEGGADEQRFVSRWRVWMQTRYVGPVIEVVFTVRRPSSVDPGKGVVLQEWLTALWH